MVPDDTTRCVVRQLRPADGLDAFYTQGCFPLGLPIVASSEVDDRALRAAGAIVLGVLGDKPALVAALQQSDLRIGVLGRNQHAPEMPEYRDLPLNYPETDWTAARAFSGRPGRPLTIAPEENLLCATDDSYPGQSVFVHELGHTALDLGASAFAPDLRRRIDDAFTSAMENGLFANSYAQTNADEYWAEAVQDYYNASRRTADPDGGGDGYDSAVATRAELKAHDPVVYDLVKYVFGTSTFTPSC